MGCRLFCGTFGVVWALVLGFVDWLMDGYSSVNVTLWSYATVLQIWSDACSTVEILLYRCDYSNRYARCLTLDAAQAYGSYHPTARKS